MQLVCRDRNRLALEADLMGAAMHGIENISCLTGDDVTAGDEPEARRVFDLDSIQLVALARTLDRGTLPLRAPDPSQAAFLRRRGREPQCAPLEYRVRRAAKKALAGARFLQLQLCYRTELLERFMRAAADTGLSERLALIPSICILRSVGGMRFVADHVPGIDVPPLMVARVQQAADAEAECFEIAYELASHALDQPGVAGLHFISFRKDAGIAKLVRSPWHPPESKGRPMDTVLRSRSGSVTIGAEQPFCIIGERINPTGRKIFAEELRGGDLSTVTADAIAQVEAGADMLDVNAGIPLVDEPELLKAMLRPCRTPSTCRSASTPR